MILLDSNILIYATRPEHSALREFPVTTPLSVSIISKIEVLGFHRLEPWEHEALSRLFQTAKVLPLTSEIADRAVQLRQRRKIGLGDAIIAATALVHGIPLATRNTSDFRHIGGLSLLNPIDQQR